MTRERPLMPGSMAANTSTTSMPPGQRRPLRRRRQTRRLRSVQRRWWQACGRAGKDRGDHGDHSGDRPVDQPAPAAKALDGKPPRWRDAGQVMSELWRMVEVVSPEPRDPFYVFKLFDSVLEHPVGGGEANEGERRQQYQAEGIERRADAVRWRSARERPAPRIPSRGRSLPGLSLR